MTPNDEVLNSWKEVASYLGRGVRTVQRWEQELGLPVRRPRGKSRSAVIAFKSELDKWLRQAPAEQLHHDHEHAPDANSAASPVRLDLDGNQRQAQLRENAEQLINRTHVLVSHSRILRERLLALRNKMDVTVRLTMCNAEEKTKTSTLIPPPSGGAQSWRERTKRQADGQ